jgi:hypothetical protein
MSAPSAREYSLRFHSRTSVELPGVDDSAHLPAYFPDGASARFRYQYRPHGYAAYADGKVMALEADRNSLDCVAEASHEVQMRRFMDVLPQQAGHEILSAHDLSAVCHVLAEHLPVPLMMHLLKIRQQKMRFTIRGVEQARRLSMSMRGACRRVFGTLGDYVGVCERLTYAEDIDLDDFPEVDALSVIVDFTYVYGAKGEANRYMVIWKPDGAAWMVARKMGMHSEPFFWLHENTNDEMDDLASPLTLVSVKFLPVRYRRCPACGRAILPMGPFIYDRAATYFTALIDNLNLCLCS